MCTYILTYFFLKKLIEFYENHAFFMFPGDLFFKLAPLFPAYSVIPMDVPLINAV